MKSLDEEKQKINEVVLYLGNWGNIGSSENISFA